MTTTPTNTPRISHPALGTVGLLLIIAPLAWAGGGFFYKDVRIDQAGEQIIFRQDGNVITAVLLIQYEGEAEDFAWVLPVPSEPEITLASDLIFEPLERATRPQFWLDVEGSPCPPRDGGEGEGEGEGEGDGEPDPAAPDVYIVEELDVGPYAIQIVTSEDPNALADWLDANGYDLTERGRELIALYVADDSYFIAMKLRQDQEAGDLQPIQVVFESDMPMVPLRITAVAALPDMGITVWILGRARAVPLNYPHVEVNYTRLNWYGGTSSAYADYQALVTEAMNEVGGLGFATDYAGTDVDLVAQFPDPEAFRSEIEYLQDLEPGATANEEFYDELVYGGVLPLEKVFAILRRQVPLPEGTDEEVYVDAWWLTEVIDEQTLTDARPAILTELTDSVVTPLEDTLAVFEGVPYTTRLYTTLSPEEMTRDPYFSFNPDLEGQPRRRNATLQTACLADQTVRELILGEGTGREDEVVIRFVDQPDYDSFLIDARENVDQSAVRQRATLSTSGPAQVETENVFKMIEVGELLGDWGDDSVTTTDGNSTAAESDGTTEEGGHGSGGGGGSGGGACGLGLLSCLPLGLGALFIRPRRRP